MSKRKVDDSPAVGAAVEKKARAVSDSESDNDDGDPIAEAKKHIARIKEPVESDPVHRAKAREAQLLETIKLPVCTGCNAPSVGECMICTEYDCLTCIERCFETVWSGGDPPRCETCDPNDNLNKYCDNTSIAQCTHCNKLQCVHCFTACSKRALTRDMVRTFAPLVAPAAPAAPVVLASPAAPPAPAAPAAPAAPVE